MRERGRVSPPLLLLKEGRKEGREKVRIRIERKGNRVVKQGEEEKKGRTYSNNINNYYLTTLFKANSRWRLTRRRRRKNVFFCNLSIYLFIY